MEILNDPQLKIAPREIQDQLKQAVQAFNALPVKEGRLPAVGVVGEIYVRLIPLVEETWCPGCSSRELKCRRSRDRP